MVSVHYIQPPVMKPLRRRLAFNGGEALDSRPQCRDRRLSTPSEEWRHLRTGQSAAARPMPGLWLEVNALRLRTQSHRALGLGELERRFPYREGELLYLARNSLVGAKATALCNRTVCTGRPFHCHCQRDPSSGIVALLARANATHHAEPKGLARFLLQTAYRHAESVISFPTRWWQTTSRFHESLTVMTNRRALVSVISVERSAIKEKKKKN